MLTLKIDDVEVYDDRNNQFETIKSKGYYHFEHSLKSVSKWEETYCKPFLDDGKKSSSELRTYCAYMCLEDIDIRLMTDEVVLAITEYIRKVPSATRIKDGPQPASNSYTSSELIYAILAEFGIPFDCDKWNLYRLINLIRIMQDRANPDKKKVPVNQILRDNARLNEERKRALHTKG